MSNETHNEDLIACLASQAKAIRLLAKENSELRIHLLHAKDSVDYHVREIKRLGEMVDKAYVRDANDQVVLRYKP